MRKAVFLVNLTILLALLTPLVLSQLPSPQIGVAHVISGFASSRNATGGYTVNYAERLANLVHDHMYDATHGGYHFEVSDDWSSVTSTDKGFLGNTFIARGFLQLYNRTENATYLCWAETLINNLWTKCWNQTGNLGFFNEYYKNWTRKTDSQTLQEQAEFVHVALDAYEYTSNATYYRWADETMRFIMDCYHDDTNGAMFKTRNGVTGSISDTDKHIEFSLGAFMWAAMRWYKYTSNQTAKTYSQECADWMRNYLWNPASKGYMTETDSAGSVTNQCFYPNVEIWGMVGLMELYKQTSNATIKSWIRDGLDHINRTMWDKVYGGWYKKLNPDNSVLEDSKTGWDNVEQPWFWYHAYEVLEDTSDRDTAMRSLNWTSDHLWDPVNGGVWLETYRNGSTVSSDTKNDWVEGGAMVAFSYVTWSKPSPTLTPTSTPTPHVPPKSPEPLPERFLLPALARLFENYALQTAFISITCFLFLFVACKKHMCNLKVAAPFGTLFIIVGGFGFLSALLTDNSTLYPFSFVIFLIGVLFFATRWFLITKRACNM